MREDEQCEHVFLELSIWKASPKEKCISWLKTFFLFLLRISPPLCAFTFVWVRERFRVKRTETKSNMKTGSVCAECVSFHTSGRCLKVAFMFCLTVFSDSFQLWRSHTTTPVSEPICCTRSCFGYEEAYKHACTYSTYRDIQIHPDACFGDHVDYMITPDG